MSYQVLARKWRPQNFKEMVGQNHVLKALINALQEQRLHHAYLFTGTRGVGKTTVARILAKCLNCETGITSEPCGTCGACNEIAEGRFVDLIEVDAASRTKVEDTRELLENVQYAPTRGRFKVYLIDEVHMLSNHSFNALLKTLEEPPSHVKFLLATTDPQKLPATILSRCLQFNLKRMSVDTLVQHLTYILQQESVSHSDAAIKQLAIAADGSMRDALSLMDQAIAFGEGELKDSDVQDMLGGIPHEHLFNILEAVIAGDGQALLTGIDEMSSATPDYQVAADNLIALLHQITIAQVVPQVEQDNEKVNQLAQKISPEDIQLFYQIALNGRKDLPLTPDPRSGFEMILLRMLAFRPVDMDQVEDLSSGKKKTLNNTSVAAIPRNKATQQLETSPHCLNQKIEPKQEVIQQQPVAFAEDKIVEKAVVEVKQAQIINKSSHHHHSGAITENTTEWLEIYPQLRLSGMTAELARNCSWDGKQKNDVITLLLDMSQEQLHTDATEAKLKAALEQYFSKSIKLSLVVQQTVSETSPHLETPAQKMEREQQERQKAAEQEIYNDPFVKALQERFDAQIVEGSIKPIDNEVKEI